MTYATVSSLEAVTWVEAFISIFTNFKLLLCPFYRLGAFVWIGAYMVIYGTVPLQLVATSAIVLLWHNGYKEHQAAVHQGDCHCNAIAAHC